MELPFKSNNVFTIAQIFSGHMKPVEMLVTTNLVIGLLDRCRISIKQYFYMIFRIFLHIFICRPIQKDFRNLVLHSLKLLKFIYKKNQANFIILTF